MRRRMRKRMRRRMRRRNDSILGWGEGRGVKTDGVGRLNGGEMALLALSKALDDSIF